VAKKAWHSIRKRMGGESESGGVHKQLCDKTLLLQAQNGNEQTRERLCEFIFLAAHNYARTRHLPRPHRAKDFAQEVVIEFLSQLDEIKDLGHWLYPVLVGRRAAMYRNSDSKFLDFLDETELEKIKAKSEQIDIAEIDYAAHLDFSLFLTQLSKVQNFIVSLYYLDGLRSSDIAVMLNIKSSTVRMHLMRAKKKLYNFLNPPGEAYNDETEPSRA